MQRTLWLTVFLFITIVFARNPKDRYGILYVNEILANSDTFSVIIEDSIVIENTLQVDFIEEWSGGSTGVKSEGIYFNDGDVVLADDFLVNPDTTFPGELYANGGILADAGNDDTTTRNREDFYSFIVEDDTGRTTFGGVLFVDEGIFVNGNAFTVAAGSGETVVRDARLNPSGGINVNGEGFTISPDGSIYANEATHIVGNIALGTAATQDRYIRRVPTLSQVGGQTLFAAQDGVNSGGDLVFEPGFEDDTCYDDQDGFKNCADGNVFVGGIDNANVQFTRPGVNGVGGITFFNGQNSPNGDGGDIIFATGDSSRDGKGGDLIVVPGLGAQGEHGHIYFGADESVEAVSSAFDLIIGRPPLLVGNGGDTFFHGQDAENGDAGNINILAGHGPTGAALVLSPGDADQDTGVLEEQGTIFLGNEESGELAVVRSVALNGAGGTTFYTAQSVTGTGAVGGDLYIAPGDSKTNGNGGSLHLLPGSNPATPGQFGVPAGQIFLGDLVGDLTITREPRDGGGLDTWIFGQGGAGTQGGDLFFIGGASGSLGGDVFVTGGDATPDAYDNAFDVGGAVVMESGNGQIDGGSINMYAGQGSVLISTDSATASGNIYLNAGSGPTMGDIVVTGTNIQAFVLDTTPLVIRDSHLEIENAENILTIRADPMSIVEYNGKTILRSVSDYPVPAVSTAVIAPTSDLELSVTAHRLAELQNSIEILLNTLSQCQHGLFQTNNQFGLPDSCVAFTV